MDQRAEEVAEVEGPTLEPKMAVQVRPGQWACPQAVVPSNPPVVVEKGAVHPAVEWQKEVGVRLL